MMNIERIKMVRKNTENKIHFLFIELNLMAKETKEYEDRIEKMSLEEYLENEQKYENEWYKYLNAMTEISDRKWQLEKRLKSLETIEKKMKNRRA